MRAIVFGVIGIVMVLLSFGCAYAMVGIESTALATWCGIMSGALGVGAAVTLFGAVAFAGEDLS